MPGAIRLSVLWYLLVISAAFEAYDDFQPNEMDPGLSYQDDIDIASLPPRWRELIMLRLIKALPPQEGYSKIYFRPQYWNDEQRLFGNSIHDTPVDMKDQVVKRGPGVLATAKVNSLGKLDYARQQRWKSKKGKTVGSQMVCYFKLCAFRSPE